MMRRLLYPVLIIVLLFAIYTVAGAHYQGNGMMGYGMMGNGMMGHGNYGPGLNYGYGHMMGNYVPDRTDYSLDAVGMTEVQVQELAEELVAEQFGTDYQIGDILIFSNTPYYVSVIEKDTGEGAFELLLDPIRKTIFPEYGPNMMWNTRNGMSHMMGWGYADEDNQMGRQKALDYAREFARNNGFVVREEGHHFPGYYTFHTERDGLAEGMLSVNAYNGQVWYHNWHGDLVEVMETENH